MGSDGEAEQGTKTSHASVSQTFDNIHPAFRSNAGSSDSLPNTLANKTSHVGNPELRYSGSHDLKTIEENEASEAVPSMVLEKTSGKDADSPTLGPSGLGLSGLVRTHLRHDSDKSSIYPPPSPITLASPIEGNKQTDPPVRAVRPADNTSSIHSNPWEYDNLDERNGTEQPDSTQPAYPNLTTMSMRAKQILGQATALKGQNQEKSTNQPKEAENIKPQDQVSNGTPWRGDVKSGHHRGLSSETQIEREEFANELAERRKKVQEKLKSFAESESRSNSPSSAHRFPDHSPARAANAFGILKTMAGKTILTGKQDSSQSKALKLLGMDNSSLNGSTSNLTDDPWREEEERMLRDFKGQRNRPRQPQTPPIQRIKQDEPQNSFHNNPSASWASDPRDRSNSDVSQRSRSRPRPRDGLEAFSENTDRRHDMHVVEERPPKVPPSIPSSARPSIEVNNRLPERNPPGNAGRFRSDSRSTAPGYFDFQPPGPIQTNHPALISNSPRPSPGTPYSANATPPLFETSPTTSTVSTPMLLSPSTYNPGGPRNQGLGSHKRVVDKSQISEPKFVSSTSNVATVGLPPGTNLSNGVTSPPLPPMNPRRRRQTTTQTILGALKGFEKNDAAVLPPPNNKPVAEASTFSDEDKRSRPRQRLRKTSSEGGNLNAKARQQAMMASSPALPRFPKQVPVEGGMF